MIRRVLTSIIIFAAALCAAPAAVADIGTAAAVETAKVTAVEGGIELAALPQAAEAAQFEVYSILGTHQGKVTLQPSQTHRMELRSGCYIVRCIQPRAKGVPSEAKVTSVKLTVK